MTRTRRRRQKKKTKTTKKKRATTPRQRRAVRKDSQIRILRWGTRPGWRQSTAVGSPSTASVAYFEAPVLTTISYRCPAAQVSCSPEGMREDGGGRQDEGSAESAGISANGAAERIKVLPEPTG